MGSALSGVLRSLFLELVDSDPFKFIIPKDSNYFNYVDDILLMYPRNNDRTQITFRISVSGYGTISSNIFSILIFEMRLDVR